MFLFREIYEERVHIKEKLMKNSILKNMYYY